MLKGAKIISFALLFLCARAQAQDGPTTVTDDLAKKINTQIEKDVQKLKIKLEKEEDADKEWIEFSLDTFRIERYESKYLQYDYSTAGMNDAAHETAAKYDKLLNKYYKKLIDKLDKEDRTALIEAQRAWIAFRDKELAWESILEQEKYSGGGTAQVIRHASFFCNQVRNRTMDLFEYYISIGKF